MLLAVVLPIEAEQHVVVWQGLDIAGHLGWIFPGHVPVGAVPDDPLRPFCRIEKGRELVGLFSGHHRLGQPQSASQNQKK